MRFFYIAVVCFSLSACSTLNILKGPDDYTRNYLARDIRSGINDAVAREVAKTPPNGYLTRPYSKKDWTEYWNHRIHHLHDIGESDSSFDRAYRGPNGDEWISYILQQRESAGLPDLEVEPRNRTHIP